MTEKKKEWGDELARASEVLGSPVMDLSSRDCVYETVEEVEIAAEDLLECLLIENADNLRCLNNYE
jgi:Ni2+-binding GTPase involved in maturation of urease and hydrogenase